ncbi:MAG: HD domain-containing protein [Tannerellaceae bacterium]|jgi:HD superfamily phosphohydrolase|nr:HD domain-containing protein [Tannerellaceae bacterium]
MDINKVFRDPIYKLISFHKKEDEVILKIISTPEFQRLRRIRQLGLSSFTYPTAVHDRFSHSLGVAYVIELFFHNLNIPDTVITTTKEGDEIELTKKQLKLLIKLAGILHDIGHGPFSHAFESITDSDHEEMTKKIISNEEGNIYKILTSMQDEILSKYAPFWINEIISGTFSPIWAKELISSQLDADRIDYLLRDAYMCGVNYASFDLTWFFQNIEIGKIKNEEGRDGLLVNAKKGIHAIESFIISRYHMYEQVYFHKTTRCFELIVQGIFKRLRYLIENDMIPRTPFGGYLVDFIKNNNNLNSYLLLDDFSLYTHFNHWTNSNDEILSNLCKSLIYREPYKMFKEVENDSLFSRKDYTYLRTLFTDDEDFDYCFLEDEYLNIAYKDSYLLGEKKHDRAEHIWLQYPNGDLKEFSEVSPIVKSLKNKVLHKKRAYIHRSYKEQVLIKNKQL